MIKINQVRKQVLSEVYSPGVQYIFYPGWDPFFHRLSTVYWLFMS